MNISLSRHIQRMSRVGNSTCGPSEKVKVTTFITEKFTIAECDMAWVI